MNNKVKVVVIDDSPIVRKMAEVALEEEGYEVYSAEDGEEGIKITQEVMPSVILVDFIMPKMSGYQFCQTIKENQPLKDIPIILITGKGEDVGKKFLEKFGVVDYFIKPFKSADLVDKVNSIIQMQNTMFQEKDLASSVGLQQETFTIELPEPIEIETIQEIEPAEKISQQETFTIELPEPIEIETIQEIEPAEKISQRETFAIELPEPIEIETIQEIEPAEKISQRETFAIELPEPIEIETIQEIEPAEEISQREPFTIELPESIEIETIQEIEPAEKISQQETFTIELPEPIEIETIQEIEPAEEISQREPFTIELPESIEIEKIKPAQTPISAEVEKIQMGTPYVSSIENEVERITKKFLQEDFQFIIQKSITDILKQTGVIKSSDIVLSGDFSVLPIRSILHSIAGRGLTVKLSIFSDILSADFYFDQGNIICASTNRQSTAPVPDSGMAISGDSTEDTAKESIYDALCAVMELESGNFAIEKISLSDNLKDIPVRLSVSHSLIEASRKANDKTFVNMFSDRTIFFKEVADNELRDYNLNKSELRICACINGERSVSDIVDISGLDKMQAFRVFYVLLNGGIAKRIKGRE